MNKVSYYILPIINRYINLKYSNLLQNIICKEDYIILKYIDNTVLERQDGKWKGFPMYIIEIKKSIIFKTSKHKDGFIYIYLEIPIEFSDDYNKIITGQYSKMSKKCKNILLEYFVKKSRVYTVKYLQGVLYKEKWLKEHLEKELEYKFNNEQELESILLDSCEEEL